MIGSELFCSYRSNNLILEEGLLSFSSMYQIIVPLDNIVLEWFCLKSLFELLTQFYKESWNEFWVKIMTKFPIISEIPTKLALHLNQIVSHLGKVYKMLCALQSQIFNLNLIPFV